MEISDKRDFSSKIVILAAALGFCGVGLGAFGAHALKEGLESRGMAGVWDTAVKYHLIHAVALLALGAWVEAWSGRSGASARRGTKLMRGVAGCWVAGVALFSGSLYLLALGGPHWLGPVTPLGGLALLVGWVLLLVAAWRN